MTETPTVSVLAPTATAHRISRRGFLTAMGVAGAAIAAPTLAGCASGDKKVAASKPLTDTIEDRLNYYSWGDYENPDDLTKIQEELGFTMQIDSYGSNEQLVAKLGAARGTSGYDVVVPTGLFIPEMAKHKLIQPLDMSKIPNFANLDDQYIRPPFDPTNTYSVCKDFGTTGMLYDKTVITTPMRSWSDFLAAAQGQARGKVSLLEDPWEVLCIALGALGINPNTTNMADLNKAEALLMDQLASTVRAYQSSIVTAATGGGFALFHAWNGDARQALMSMDKPEDWEFVFPTPTANFWSDNFVIATGTQHPGAAHAFINAMLDPEISYSEMDYIGYNTGVKGLVARAEADKLDHLDLLFPSKEILARLTTAVLDEMTSYRTEILSRLQARSAQ